MVDGLYQVGKLYCVCIDYVLRSIGRAIVSDDNFISEVCLLGEDGIQGFGEVWSVVVCETTYADFYIVHFISADALIIYNNGAFCILTTSENQSPHIC